ncbi:MULTISPECIES: SDR family oxidoreductase [Streptomyces]|uniref:SDR family oxidoreductase n=2 Tax=Streptomyces scabiei TaxID=1930 RepID=UPI0004E77EEC|nr:MULTISPECIES: SDR family oxidoreductase [Streptomyces]MBP5871401.1 SDR family oxidoreductase [Streptomyces sp. LBUM 1485]MBP5909728.1 SDR family oxidoreductase [Streptomyces sp. LBUM 1478]MBP5927272.1 SDR family oxidoreductase [Streptomyces sp. LBUM 1479]KFG06249.1 short-chain dehydrogenase [Streptomyces scabiei]MBP5879862.1 SDR family oxidoreductase [Streptomyces sp. LBUM 1477]
MAEQPPDRSREAVVVTGAGGMGMAVARRIGSGRTLFLADASPGRLHLAVQELRDEGYAARGVVTDVSDRDAVDRLAREAAGAGRVAAVVHTAGLSAVQAPARRILEVDLLGTAHVVDAFEAVATPGTALVCVASMAGHVASLTGEEETALATAPARDLLTTGAVLAVGDSPTRAYGVSKRGNQLRAEAAALAWSRRGARVNSVSPGVVATAMAKAEAEGPSGARMRAMQEASGAGRSGTPAEIAGAVAFLVGPEARYINGTDLLVDGGQAAWLRHHRPH